MASLRLDQLLALSGERSRREAARLLRDGLVRVDGEVCKDAGQKVDPEQQSVTLLGEPVDGRAFRYVMLHKPAGVLTAARDSRASTVMDLVPEPLARRGVLPVGRLDKDTTGLLLLTNDGELAHRLLSPKRHVAKEYHAVVSGPLTEADVLALAQGIPLSDFTAKPAKMQILDSTPEVSQAVLWLCEGKFHPVKRMFAALGHEVLRLHRAAFGPLRLPEDLAEGCWRELQKDELDALQAACR